MGERNALTRLQYVGPVVFPTHGQEEGFTADVEHLAVVGANREESCPPVTIRQLHELGVVCSNDRIFAVQVALGEDGVVFGRHVGAEYIVRAEVSLWWWILVPPSLLLYDDAQSIYKKKNSLSFTLSSVVVAGLGALKDDEEKKPEEARLLYVAMTRAQEYLLLTASKKNYYTRRFSKG